jgi:hypothetical protein
MDRPAANTDALRALFKKQKIATLDELKQAIGTTCTMTAFRPTFRTSPFQFPRICLGWRDASGDRATSVGRLTGGRSAHSGRARPSCRGDGQPAGVAFLFVGLIGASVLRPMRPIFKMT